MSKELTPNVESDEKEFLTKIDINLGSSHAMYKTSIGNLLKNFYKIGIQRKRQRKYLYNDIPGGKGHKWQRELFLSLLVGIPMGEFMFTQMEIEDEDGNIKIVYLNEDGQQRMYTTIAIINNMVKLPDVIPYRGYEQYAGKQFSQLPQKLQDKILYATELPIKMSFLNDEESRYIEFVLANSGNQLSAQDLRSGQPTEGASYIQSLVDGDNEIQFGNYVGMTYPNYDMFQVQVVDGKCSHVYVEIDPNGRAMEEITANWYSWLRYKGTKDMKQDVLNRMYSEFNNGNNITSSEKNLFEKYLKKMNSILTKNKKRKGLTKKPLDYLFPVMKEFMDNNVKINDNTFAKQYLDAIEKLKKQNKTWFPKTTNNGKPKKSNKFDYVFRQITSNEAIKYIVDEIYKTMVAKMKSNGTYIELDSKREFSLGDKRVKLAEQDYKCGYCGTEISDVSESEGDHTFPYSKGGMTDMENLTVACPSCNQLKSDMTPEEWETFQKKGSPSFEYWGLVSDASRPFDTNNFNSATR